MDINDFDYELPEELIAQKPAVERDSSRLLVYTRSTGKIDHCVFSDIAAFLNRGDCLVINKTKVIPAKLSCRKNTGGRIELLVLRKISDSSYAVLARDNLLNREIIFPDNTTKGKVTGRTAEGEFIIEIKGVNSLKKILDEYGEVPLPHYIKRKDAENEDFERYQTIFAEKEGSIAAPTAGFHFTDKLLSELECRGVEIARITLHVGWGTFRPVRTATVEGHRMLGEFYEVDETNSKKINETKKNGGRIIAVGTTVVRTLESLSNGGGAIKQGTGQTNLFIYPGYEYKSVDSLLTNFHVPKSTPLLLVCAFAGRENVFKAYREAISLKYRFYSYGDAMFVI